MNNIIPPPSGPKKARTWFSGKKVRSHSSKRIAAGTKEIQQKLREVQMDHQALRRQSEALSDFSQFAPQALADWTALLTQHEARRIESEAQLQAKAASVDRIRAGAIEIQQELRAARTDLGKLRLESIKLADFSQIGPQALADWDAVRTKHEAQLLERATELSKTQIELQRTQQDLEHQCERTSEAEASALALKYELKAAQEIIGYKTDKRKPFYWKIGDKRGSFSRTLFDTYPSWMSSVHNGDYGIPNDADHPLEIECDWKVWRQLLEFMRNGEIPTPEQAEFGLLGQAERFQIMPLIKGLLGDESRFYWRLDNGEQGSFPRAILDKFPKCVLSKEYNQADSVVNNRARPALIDCGDKVWRQVVEYMRNSQIPRPEQAAHGLLGQAQAWALNDLVEGLQAQTPGVYVLDSSPTEYRAKFCFQPNLNPYPIEGGIIDQVKFNWGGEPWIVIFKETGVFLALVGDQNKSAKLRMRIAPIVAENQHPYVHERALSLDRGGIGIDFRSEKMALRALARPFLVMEIHLQTP